MSPKMARNLLWCPVARCCEEGTRQRCHRQLRLLARSPTPGVPKNKAISRAKGCEWRARHTPPRYHTRAHSPALAPRPERAYKGRVSRPGRRPRPITAHRRAETLDLRCLAWLPCAPRSSPLRQSPATTLPDPDASTSVDGADKEVAGDRIKGRPLHDVLDAPHSPQPRPQLHPTAPQAVTRHTTCLQFAAASTLRLGTLRANRKTNASSRSGLEP